ncbi:MAG TPA: Gfo/Idh/MocA family oxidoreductase [Opitutaceae bacterium]|nr:Gfo/Idh/MocA family oxidoreductase [Opitutaceae bacterium]
MTDLNIGIIGSGGRGATLGAAAHLPGRGARVVACCDADEHALARNRANYGRGIFTTSDYQELLARDLDAVIVATPDFLHEEHAIAALSSGRAVYLEKPMAISIAGCDGILRAAAKAKARLYVGHNMRHVPFVRKMKALIDDGAIGEVKACWVRHFVGNGGDYYFRDWHAERRFSTGLLLQKASHDIDVIHWLSGGYTRQVSAMGELTLYGKVESRLPAIRGPRRREGPLCRPEIWPPMKQRDLNHRIDVEDLSQMLMRLDNGVLAQYAQCHYTPDYWRNYTVIGTEGRMENFGNGGSGTCVRLWNRRSLGYSARGSANFVIRAERGGHGGADLKIIAEFLRYAREGGEITTSAIAARESVATGCVATESLRHGSKALPVPRVPASVSRYFKNEAAVEA